VSYLDCVSEKPWFKVHIYVAYPTSPAAAVSPGPEPSTTLFWLQRRAQCPRMAVAALTFSLLPVKSCSELTGLVRTERSLDLHRRHRLGPAHPTLALGSRRCEYSHVDLRR